MPFETLMVNDFSGGWSPNDDAINGDKKSLLQMSNLQLDKRGSLSLVNGTTVLRQVGDSDAHTLYSKFLQGIRHDYTSLVSGKVFRDGTQLTAGGSNSRTGFSTAFNNTLIASGTYRVKDDGVDTPNNLGIGTPTVKPTLTQFQYKSPLLITDATDVNGYHGVTATLVNSGGFDFLTQWQCNATDFLFVFATYDSARTTNTTILTQNTVGSTTTPSDPNDIFEVDLFSIDGSGNPNSAGIDMGNISSIQFAIYLSRPSSLSPTIEFASDYYTYTWTSDLGPNGDDIRVVSGSRITFKIRRQQFTRVGGNITLDWNDVVGYVIGIQCVGVMASTAGISIPQAFVGGQAGMISGTNDVQVQYAQMNVAKTTSYTAKSVLGPPTQLSNVEDSGFALVPQTPTDPQVTNIWIFRQDNGLSKWYRVLDIPVANAAANTIDTLNDDSALTLDITVDLNLVSTGSSGVIDDILEIIGPISGRWYYITATFLYPSDINDPDLTNPGIGIRICGSKSEVFLWSRKISEAQILIGTSIDVYLLTGTFTTLPDGSIDIFYRPLGTKFAPISRDASVFSGNVYYLSDIGWASINVGGQNQILVIPNTSLLYEGFERYGYVAPVIDSNSPGSVNYPCVVAKGKLFCVVTGTGRIEVFDFSRQYWQPTKYGLGDASAICATQDGEILGYYGSDNKLRTIGDHTTKLVDGTTKQTIELLLVAQDGGGSYSRNRKDLATFKSRIFTSGNNIAVSLITDQGTFPCGNISSGVEDTEEFLDISGLLATCKWWQFSLVGQVGDFLLQDLSLDVQLRPTPLTFVKELNKNFGSGQRKRVRTWPFTIDTRAANVTITPYVDGVAQPGIQFNTNDKLTVLYKFLTDVFGIDYGYTIKYSGKTMFEFYGDLQPDIVQTLPIAKRFDQLGPQEFFRYGKIQKISIRILPWDTDNIANTVLDIPYTIYFNDQTVQQGTIKVLNLAEGSYTIGEPKGTSGAIMRLEIGPTEFDFHRFDIKVQVNKSGNQTDGEWIKIG